MTGHLLAAATILALAALIHLDSELAETQRATAALMRPRAKPSPDRISIDPCIPLTAAVDNLRARTEYLRTIAQLITDHVTWGKRAALPRPMFPWSGVEIRTEQSYRAALRGTR